MALFKKLIYAYKPTEMIFEFILKMGILSEIFNQVLVEERTTVGQLANWLRTFRNIKDQLLKERSQVKIFSKKPQPSLKFLETIRKASILK